MVRTFTGKKRSLTSLIKDLIGDAISHRFLYACPPDHCQRIHREKGEPFCDYCKPGYLIKKLDDEDREVLKECKEKDFNHRIY